MPDIHALRFQHRVVDALPGDPIVENRTRSVLHACYSPVMPTPVAAPSLLAVAPEVAQQLELSPEPTPELTEVLAGNRVLPGMRPYAACYGGHQFGHWAGQLGDGRAITLTEIENDRGERYELQLKGAGRTPYSRNGDGRAVLRSSLREYVCSEAMHRLGVPTTRALSLALAGEDVVRDLLYDGHPGYEPAAIVARVAPTFLRFGNFEIHTARKDYDTLTRLVQFSVENYFPQFARDGAVDLGGWFGEICQRTARLMVEWTRVGFVHGVMNTDNMSILGLTIDYGPYSFLDVFDPDWTPNTTDAQGRRYRFGQQPRVAHWNLAQFARAIAPLFDDVEPLEKSLAAYAESYATREKQMWFAKLGLSERGDRDALLAGLFPALSAIETDMTLFFRTLPELPDDSRDAMLHTLREAFYDLEGADRAQLDVLTPWLEQYRECVRAE
ncbi:MAG TPA: YdiU family protein, partial [Polyangiales bacterium]|nr:YdiU family protein [Polyangiales bacterium]